MDQITKNEIQIDATESGKNAVRENLGNIRGFASQVAQGNDINEEEFFIMVRDAWLKGLVSEMSSLFGAEETQKMMDPFNGKTNRS